MSNQTNEIVSKEEIATNSLKSTRRQQDEKPAIFPEIDADESAAEVTEIESACMRCFKMGMTRLLLTKIPFFKELILTSFKCEFCCYENNEIRSAAEIQRKGIRINLEVKSAIDLNRRVVRSDYTLVKIPEVDLEIPAQSQKSEITTVEGIIDRTIRGLSQDQEKRHNDQAELAASLDVYIARLNDLKELKMPFTLIIEDISGNSYVENPEAPSTDHSCKISYFSRSIEQNNLLGFYDSEARNFIDRVTTLEKDGDKHILKPNAEGSFTFEDLHGEVLQFPTLCPGCGSPCLTNMKLTNIPYFKDVVIMATACDTCGNKTNEVKSGNGIEEKGRCFEVTINSKEDLTRDVLTSETCRLAIPELDCEVGPFALAGRFTTIEVLLGAMKDQLAGNDVMFHDSSDAASKNRFAEFLERFDKIIQLKTEATLILNDPAGNSFVQSLALGSDQLDEKLKIAEFERSSEENEELGLNDMKTENYEE